MSVESVRKLLVVTAEESVARAEAANEAAKSSMKDFKSCLRNNRSAKQRDRVTTRLDRAVAASVDAEMEAGRAIQNLLQFEEDNGLKASILVEVDEELDSEAEAIETENKMRA